MSRAARVLVKVGGASVEDAEARRVLAEAVAAARSDGLEVVLVHGGGPQIRRLAARLGLPERTHRGLRITDAETAEVATMVLSGSIGRRLVATLEAAGVRAVSLTGADGATFHARPHRPGGADLGYVGVPGEVRPELVERLLAWGAVPVLATVAPAEGGAADGPFLNVNADAAVPPLARALGCADVLFLTDVDGVRDEAGLLRARLAVAEARALEAAGAVRGGMIPKLEAAVAVAGDGPERRVTIAPAGPDAIRRALAGEVGTRLSAAPTTVAARG